MLIYSLIQLLLIGANAKNSSSSPNELVKLFDFKMHRIFKIYKFSYSLYGVEKKNSQITFSSYPGTLTSTDDFYVLKQFQFVFAGFDEASCGLWLLC